jgi:asparagine N-glycosylation enzyme membrane subunit Stt3
MHKLYLVLLLVGVLLISGCMQQIAPDGIQQNGSQNGSQNASPNIKVTDVEHVGGKYNATISTLELSSTYQDKVYTSSGHEIEYTVNGKTYTHGYFEAKFRPALDWIKASTPDYAKFLTWWDYGHMIRGYAERAAIIYGPSQDILWSVAGTSRITEFEPEQKVEDVAMALTTNDSEETKSVMKKYGATYVLVTIDDVGKSMALFNISGKFIPDYIGNDEKFTKLGEGTAIFRFLNNSNPGFEMVYEDSYVRVYELTSGT